MVSLTSSLDLASCFRFLLFSSLLSVVFAHEDHGEHGQPEHGGHGKHPGRKHCTVKHNRDGSDDSPNILAAFAECATNSLITFSRANYSAFTPVALTGLDDVIIHLDGNLLLPSSIPQVQHAINITKNQPSTYATPWFYFHGSNVQLIAADDFAWGRFIGFGEHWWDLRQQTLRPQLATFNITTGLMRNIKVIKPIAWGWNLPGTNIRVENHFVDAQPSNASRWETISFPFNTQASISLGKTSPSTGAIIVVAQRAYAPTYGCMHLRYFGHNGDDCISLINGADGVVAKNGFCGFSSHGLSVGSLGKNGAFQTVQNILFKNWTMDGAVYGARFKSWTGGNGFANNVTWEDIHLINVSTAIYITQNYFDQELGPPKTSGGPINSTHVSNFTYRNFTGSLNANWTDGTCITQPCWNFVPGIDGTQSIIFDLYPDTAVNISVGRVHVHPYQLPYSATNVICNATTLAPGEQDTLGFNCTRGPYVQTKTR
ncbi:unnamed protein product [Mycena citricolor]|uniref:galacturonan 1,4-alpha-galacturonidase n=1 Tax=Mycena citricolor TaxID=2018698 RepID=A0AAD2JZZ7_9AGAR|nr:unnamed protein product [Mycena citricolor]